MDSQILLLSRQPDAYAVTRFKQAAAQRGASLTLLDPHMLSLHVDGGVLCASGPDGPLDLQRTVVIPRIGSTATEYALAALEHLEAAGARTLNPAAGIHKLRNKFNMLGHLAAAAVPVPDSVMLRSNVDQSRRGGALSPPAMSTGTESGPTGGRQGAPPTGSLDVATAVARLGGFPVVLKFIRGSQGLGVIYADNETVVSSVLEAMNYAQYDVLLQRYYPAAAESDVRVLVLGGQARWAMRRHARDGKFRSNIHRGGYADAVDIASAEYAPYAALAEQAAAVFGLGLAGVDVIEGDSGLLVLEVNSSPGFEKLEEVCGADIAGAVLECCLTQC